MEKEISALNQKYDVLVGLSMPALEKSKKLKEISKVLAEKREKRRHYESVRQDKIPLHEKLDQNSVFYKHYMKKVAADMLRQAALDQRELDS